MQVRVRVRVWVQVQVQIQVQIQGGLELGSCVGDRGLGRDRVKVRQMGTVGYRHGSTFHSIHQHRAVRSAGEGVKRSIQRATGARLPMREGRVCVGGGVRL